MDENKLLLGYRYVVFGEFTAIYNDIQNVVVKFSPQFTKQLVEDTIFTAGFPQRINVYAFSSDEITVKISPNRIDFFIRTLTNDNADVKLVLDCLGKIGESFKSSNVSRIAINADYFYKDPENKISNVLCGRVNLLDGPKSAREMLVRQNQIVKIQGLSFNDIITIQNGGIQNKDTFENVIGMSLSFDINSDPETVKLINKEDLKDLFMQMKTIFVNELAEIEGKLL